MLRKLLPFIVIIAFAAAIWYVKQTPATSKRSAPAAPPAISVKTLEIEPTSFQIQISSYGIVRPRTQSNLIAQASGQIVNIGENFKNGRFFEKGELLIQLDQREYQASLKAAEASLVEAKQAVIQEQAQSNQAKADWKRLGNRGNPPALAQRIPQLKAAQARVISAEANRTKAKLELERTQILAPFAGRVLSTDVDFGQVVSNGTQLATIYATDTLEVRLPIRNKDLAFINLPENRRFNTSENSLPVTLESKLVKPEQWIAEVIRTEGALDDVSQQLNVVAQITDPYGKPNAAKQPLKVGEYVTATIEGKTLSEAIIIPNAAIYQGSYVYVVIDSSLHRRSIEFDWQNDTHTLINQGLKRGDQLVITPLGQVHSGTPVKQVPANETMISSDAAQDNAS